MEAPVLPNPSIEKISQKTNQFAIAAGACGIGSFVLQLIGLGLGSLNSSISSICNGISGWAWIAGIVLGIIGLVQIRRHPEQKGKGWAITGIGLGVLRICIVTVTSLLLVTPIIGTVSTRISTTLSVP